MCKFIFFSALTHYQIVFLQNRDAPVYFAHFPAAREEPAQDLIRLLSAEKISLEGLFTVYERNQMR